MRQQNLILDANPHDIRAVTRGTAAFTPISTAMMLNRTISGGSQLACVFGQLLRPATLLAQCRQADGATLLTSETSAGDSPCANQRGGAVDLSNVPAVRTRHLDLQSIAGQIAKSGEGGRERHSPK